MELRQGLRGHFRSLSISSASLAVVYVFLIFISASFSSIFRLSLYMYVSVSLGPVGACVRLCLRVAFDADTPSATRARDIRISVLWMRFGEWDSASVLLCRCVLLCTHLRDLVPRFRRHPFLDLGLESVCVCVCVCVECFSRVHPTLLEGVRPRGGLSGLKKKKY